MELPVDVHREYKYIYIYARYIRETERQQEGGRGGAKKKKACSSTPCLIATIASTNHSVEGDDSNGLKFFNRDRYLM